jgi:hypothetical protein
MTASKTVLFTKSIIDIANGNFVYKVKLTIVFPVSSTLLRDGFKPTALIPVGFFWSFSGHSRKNPQSIPMRVSLSSRVPALGHGFSERIMQLNAFPVYMHCNIVHWSRKARQIDHGGLKSNPRDGWRRQAHATAVRSQK